MSRVRGHKSTRASSVLQRKGFKVLALLILAESVSLANSVTFWSAYQNWGDNTHSSRRRQQDCSVGGDLNEDGAFQRAVERAKGKLPMVESCASSPTTTITTAATATSKTMRPRLAKRMSAILNPSAVTINSPEDCCHECLPCMNTAALDACASVPRGGHIANTAAAAAASTAADAVAQTTTPYGIPLNMWKILFQIFLTTTNVVFWLLPLRFSKISDNKVALGLANAFSGGVFLSLAFGHLIPECVHGFAGDYNEALPYMIVLGGYLLIFFVEKVAFDAHGALHEMEGGSCNNGHDVKMNGGDVANSDDSDPAASNSGRSAVILLGALAVHSILEMMALGLAKTFGDSALLTLSIALHQPAESIALLVAFLKSGMPKGQIIRFLSVFSAMGPIGVALGMAVNEFAAPIVDSIMLATVAGTFIYVGATEVIPEEWEDQEHKWKKFFALITGIVSIFAITQYTTTLEGMH